MTDVLVQLKDWRGTEIGVGDTILYAVKHSTSVEVNEAIVTAAGYCEDWAGSGHFNTPCVWANWHQSSYCYRPESQYNYVGQSDRSIRKIRLTNFEGITVVKKATPPAFDSAPHFVRWAHA